MQRYQTFVDIDGREMDNVKTKWGKEKFSHDGFLYVFDKMSVDRSKKFWRRELKNECKARLHTCGDNDTNGTVTLVNEHSHGGDGGQGY